MTTMTGEMTGTMHVPSAGLRLERRARGPVRLTRRGRLVLLAGLVVLLFAAFSLGRVGAEGTTSSVPAAQLETTTVQPGETLWGVAKRLAPGQDPRPVVEQIRRINALPDAGLRAGQQLLLPAPS
jgi:hypothetical protein